jgi:hypothetical protein
MKFRLVVIVILLSVALAACSFAADITPPPGPASVNSAHNSSQAALVASQTPVPTSAPTQTSEPVATTSGTPPAVTGSTTPSAEGSPIPQTAIVVIDGTVTLPSGTTLPGGTNATLLVYNTTTQQKEQTLTTPILPTGTYEFTNIPANTNNGFLVTVDFGGVTYNSSFVAFDGTLSLLNIPITIYATSNDLNLLSITQAHLQFDFSTAGQVQVMALYVLSNPGESTVIFTSDGTTVPFISVPEGAQSVNYQLAPSSAPLLKASNGFALLPGTDKQYGIIARFTLAYTGRLVYTQPYNLPVTAATVIVPEGVKVRSDQLTDAGTQVSSGTSYHLYQGNSLASGSTMTLTISGMPGDKPGFVLNQRTWIMIGIGAIGLILIALGIFLFFRERSLRRLEMETEEDGEAGDGQDALGNDRESLLDAIIALEDKFKAGDITKEAYEKRRDELKERLTKLA